MSHPSNEQQNTSPIPNQVSSLLTGSRAARHLETYQSQISGNFETPAHVGKLVAENEAIGFASSSGPSIIEAIKLLFISRLLSEYSPTGRNRNSLERTYE